MPLSASHSVAEDLDPLQFSYQKHIGVEDGILYMLHWAYAYWDVPGSYVHMFFDFSSAFNTTHPTNPPKLKVSNNKGLLLLGQGRALTLLEPHIV